MTIDRVQSQPSWEQVVRAYVAGRRALSALEREQLEGLAATEAASSSSSEEEQEVVEAEVEADYFPAPTLLGNVEAAEVEGEADEDNLKDFIEEWGDEDEDEDYDADLSG